jgi:hypothetical protein
MPTGLTFEMTGVCVIPVLCQREVTFTAQAERMPSAICLALNVGLLWTQNVQYGLGGGTVGGQGVDHA